MKIFIQPIFVFVFLSGMGLAEAQLYDLPFKSEDMNPGEFIYWNTAWHAGMVQRFGYDLEAVQYNAAKNQWVTKKFTLVSILRLFNRNERYFLYEKPVYAMRGGKSIACWRNAPENPKPGPLHPGLVGDGDSKTPDIRIYGGGNGVWIEHSDGSLAEYGHFKTGTVPSSLCPHQSEFFTNGVASTNVWDAWPEIRVSAAQQVQVHAGQLLGRVGNSGTSSHPHLHIHVEEGGTAGTTFTPGSPVVINFLRGRSAPKSANINWTSFAGKPIPPGPVLIEPPLIRIGEYTAILQLLQMPLRGTGIQFSDLIDGIPGTGTQGPDRIKPIPVPRR